VSVRRSRSLGGRADLRRGYDEGVIFNRARPNQKVPMGASRDDVEGGRYRDHVGAGERQISIQLGKPHVEADRQPESKPFEASDDDLPAGRDDVRLAMDDRARHVDIEEMDLAVRGDDLAIRPITTLVL